MLELMEQFQGQQYQNVRMRDEQEANYLQLLEHARQSGMANRKPFTCFICCDDVAVGKGITLQECLHEFCRYGYMYI